MQPGSERVALFLEVGIGQRAVGIFDGDLAGALFGGITDQALNGSARVIVHRGLVRLRHKCCQRVRRHQRQGFNRLAGIRGHRFQYRCIMPDPALHGRLVIKPGIVVHVDPQPVAAFDHVEEQVEIGRGFRVWHEGDIHPRHRQPVRDFFEVELHFGQRQPVERAFHIQRTDKRAVGIVLMVERVHHLVAQAGQMVGNRFGRIIGCTDRQEVDGVADKGRIFQQSLTAGWHAEHHITGPG